MMQYLEMFFIYSFSCSALMVYGIGLEKVYFETHPGLQFLKNLPALFINSVLSVIVLWYLATGLLIPYRLQSLFPMAIILVCGIISAFLALIVPQPERKVTGEQIFFFGTVFLALYQATSIIDALLVVCASVVSFSLVTAVLYAIRDRLASGHPHTDWRGSPLVLVSMGLLFLGLYSADISWWMTEILK